MRKYFKYALGLLAVCVVIAFLSRERFTGYQSSEQPEKPETLLPPYGNVLYTEGGDDVAPVPGKIADDLPSV